MSSPLRAALRVAQERLGADGLRALAHAMAHAAVDAVLDDAPSERRPREHATPRPDAANDGVVVDPLAAAAARRALRRLERR